jgi:hypothetical protein
MQAREHLHGIAAFHHVAPAAAMHVQVDEAGQDVVAFVDDARLLRSGRPSMERMRWSKTMLPWVQPWE